MGGHHDHEDDPDSDRTLKTRLNKAIEYCKTFEPAQIDGAEDKDITIKLGANERKFTGYGLLQNSILPNFYFHCTTAYDILGNAVCGDECLGGNATVRGSATVAYNAAAAFRSIWRIGSTGSPDRDEVLRCSHPVPHGISPHVLT